MFLAKKIILINYMIVIDNNINKAILSLNKADINENKDFQANK